LQSWFELYNKLLGCCIKKRDKLKENVYALVFGLQQWQGL
jgi:hypothetical protein